MISGLKQRMQEDSGEKISHRFHRCSRKINLCKSVQSVRAKLNRITERTSECTQGTINRITKVDKQKNILRSAQDDKGKK